jgi:hypothetical protein
MAIVGHDMQKLFTQGIIPFAHKKCQILLEPGLQYRPYRPRSENQCAPVLMKTAKTKKTGQLLIQNSKLEGGEQKSSDFSDLSFGFLVYQSVVDQFLF